MQNYIFKILSVLCLTLALSFNTACSKPDTQSAPVESQTNTANQNFDQAFKEANNLRLKAAELEYEWINTEDLLQQAKQTFANGDSSKAMQLVKEAHQQSELAIQQAKTEATAWKSRVVK